MCGTSEPWVPVCARPQDTDHFLLRCNLLCLHEASQSHIHYLCPHTLAVLATEVPGTSVVFAWAEIQSASDDTDTRLPRESLSPQKQSVHSCLH